MRDSSTNNAGFGRAGGWSRKWAAVIATAALTASGLATGGAATAMPIAEVPGDPSTWASGPFSPLPQADLAPVNNRVIEFTGTDGGLHAAGDVDTGFTLVQPSSGFTNNGAPAWTLTTVKDTEYYIPANLAVANGRLSIAPTKGIAFDPQTAGSEGNVLKNRQDNALGVTLAPGTNVIRLQTTFTNPAGIFNSAQAGVWFGPNDDNYFKVVLAGQNGTLSDAHRQFQIKREVGGVTTSAAANEINVPFTTGGVPVGSEVTVMLDIDPVTLKATGRYQIGTGTLTTIGTQDVPASFLNGTLLTGLPTQAKAVGGIFATKRNMAETAPVSFSFARFQVNEIDTTAPAAPTALGATTTIDANTLAWTAPGDADLMGYRVYRSTTPGTVPATAANLISGATPVTGTGFVDADVFVGQTWHYSVYAVDLSGNVSGAASSSASIVPAPAGTLVEKVDFTTAAGTAAAGYTKDAGAAWSDTAGFGWFTADDATPFDFALNTRIRAAANGVTDARLLSLIHMQYGTSGTETNPPNPANGITNEQGVWEYEIPNGRYNVVVAAGDTSAGNFDSAHTVVVEGETAVDAFVGTAALPFQQGVVEVEVTDGRLTVAPTGGDNSKLSFLEIYEIELFGPPAPTDLTAEVNEDGDAVALAWQAVDGATGYNVFRSDELPVATTGTPLNGAPLTSPTFTDETVIAGGSYHYVVVALGDGPPASEPSAAASVTVPSEVVAPDAPTGVTATGGADSIAIEWDAVAGAVGYKVFRGASTPVATTGAPLSGATAITATSFEDTTAAPGLTYHYVVVAVGAENLESPASASASASIDEDLPPTACVASEWSATYYAGTSLQGAPIAEECRTGLLGWLEPGQSPAAGVPADGFSARFETTIDEGAGIYTFTVNADDGVRLFVDGDQVLNRWHVNSGWDTRTVTVQLAEGPHELVVEYYQNDGWGRLAMSYDVTPLAACTPAQWSVAYFDGTALAGEPLATECRTNLLGWLEPGDSPRGGVPAEQFSARFTKTIDDGAGTYTFTVNSDDGVRVLVDGEPVVARWHVNSGWNTVTASVQLAEGPHELVVEYYQNDGWGRLDLSYTVAPITDCVAPSWSATYFAGTALQGEPITVECLSQLSQWLAPDVQPFPGVGPNDFSARFTTTIDDGAGTYTFSVNADDGVRLIVDGETILDRWHVNSGWDTHTVSVPLAAGPHEVEVEYYQGGGWGRIAVDYDVTPLVECAASGWSGTYFAGTSLSGEPIATECRTQLPGWLAPDTSPKAGVPGSDFSARYVRTLDEGAGTYTFDVWADDGVRVLVDGVAIIDRWHINDGWSKHTASTSLSAGPHTVVVEYYQGGGWGRLDLAYTKSGVDIQPPASPTEVTAQQLDLGIAVAWETSVSSDVAGYNVYRGTAPGVTAATGTKLNTALVVGDGFQDDAVTPDVTYYYVVTAVDGAGNVSPASNEAAAMWESTPDTEAPAAPTGLSAEEGDGEITLSWTASTSSDAVGYVIHRSIVPGAILEGAVVSGAAPVTGTTWVDEGVNNETTYFYSVVAVDLAGNESDASNEIVAKPHVPNTTDLKVDFTATNGVPAAGYVADWGQPYGTRSSAGQGTGLVYGWVDADGHEVSLVTNGRDRARAGIDERLDSIIHMQYEHVDNGAGTNGVKIQGAWEIALPEGLYEVTVAVGDQMGSTAYDSQHTVNVEGSVAINSFQATAAQEFRTYTATVGVWDGRLTLDSLGGFNTKLAYVDIKGIEYDSPHIWTVFPKNRDNAADVNGGVAATIKVPYAGFGVDDTTMPGNVQVYRVSDGTAVPGSVNSSGGNDTVNFAPTEPFAPNTTYRFVVTSGLKDRLGNAWVPFEAIFTTGTGVVGPGSGDFTPLTNIAFEKVELPIGNGKYWSSFTFGPDGKLYGSTIGQGLYRFTVNADGTLSNMESLGYAGIAMIGLLFDKTSTAGDLKLWVTNTSPNVSNEQNQWASGISLLTGPNLQNRKQVFTEMPRSLSDHLTNSMVYGPGDDIYVLQGSNQAGGDLDGTWGQRGEQLLTAALLKFDPDHARVVAATSDAEGDNPLSVKTAQGGTYNPYAAGAPLTIYATGIRNAYDLVYHSNGHIYVPTNGTAAGGNTPGVNYNAANNTWTRTVGGTSNGRDTVVGQDLTAACQARDARDLSYTPRSVPGTSNVPTQRDHLYDVVAGGYYGHPNPTRCEFVLHEGNNPANPPKWGGGASGTENRYAPATVLPESHYRGVAYDFEFNKSPNGAIEYKSSTFGGQLKGKLVVVRFSNNNDLIFLQPDPATGEILGAQTEVGITGVPNTTMQGVGGFNDPLEVVENPNNGNLYINQYDRAGSSQKLYLLRVPAGQQASKIGASENELVFSAAKSNAGNASAAQKTDTASLTVTNQSTATIPLSAAISGTNAGEFTIVGSVPATLAAGASATVQVRFTPGTTIGERSAQLTLNGDGSTLSIGLYGLSTNGIEGGNEPPLDWVLGTLGYNVNVGWTNLEGGMNPAAKGEEVLEPLFVKSGTGQVTWKALSHYAPAENIPFGWYTGNGAAADRHQVGGINGTNTTGGGYQSINPPLMAGSTPSFDPGSATFGFYYFSQTFNRYGFTEDRLNSPAGSEHRARIYPAKNRSGVLIPNSYIVAFEDASNGDYQDYVFLVSGIKPVTDTGSGSDAIKVDFTSATGDVAAGYIRDYGQAFGPRTAADQGSGLVYGWKGQATEDDLNISVGGTTPGNGRDRNSSQTDVRLDSFIHMQPEDLPTTFNGTRTDAYWEIQVPNGRYEVTVGVGDATVGNDPESHVVNAEHQTILSAFSPTGAAGSNTRHKISTGTVDVTDGHLTIDPLGGVNTKIGFVDIVPVEVTDPTGDPSDGAQVKVTFQPAGTPVATGWTAETGTAFSTTRGYGWLNAANGQPVDRSVATRYRTAPLSPIAYPTDDRLKGYAFVDNSTQPTYTNGVWEYVVPNGEYEVAVSVGDANYLDSTHGLQVEGQPIIQSFVPTATTPFQTGVRDVTVTDGRITLTNNGTNTKINWISIKGAALEPSVPTTSAKFSFRPSGSAVPAGWVADTGAAYSATTGHGWIVNGAPFDRSNMTRLRTGATSGITYPTGVPERQGLILMQATTTTGGTIEGGTVGVWEYAVANGTYTVSASVGDAGYLDSVHGVSAEGVPLVTNYTPTGTAPFATGTASVVVTDGKLSLSATGVNTKLNWVTVSGSALSAPSIGITVNGASIDEEYEGGAATVGASALAASGATIASLTYAIEGGAATPYTAPFAITAEGEYDVVFTATDSAGRTTTRTVTLTVLDIGGTLKFTNPQIPHQADGSAIPGLSDETLTLHRINSGTTNAGGTVLYRTHDTGAVTISNTGTKDLRITSLTLGGAQAAQFELVNPPTLPLFIEPGQSVPLNVRFIANTGGKGVRTASVTIASSDTAAATKVLQLRGGYMTAPEGGSELSLEQIFQVFNSTTTSGTAALGLGNGSELPGAAMDGDEIRSLQWKRLDSSKPVQAVQLAAFHGQGGTETLTVNGVNAVMAGIDAQTLFPRKSDGTITALSTSPTGNFTIGVNGKFTNNTTYMAVKLWPVKDAAGKTVPGAWFVGHDYVSSGGGPTSPGGCGNGATNCDYQDNVYLITNTIPVASSDTTAPAAPLAPTGTADTTGVDLTWAASTDADLIGYRVERATAAAGPWTQVSGTGLVTGTTFRDASAPAIATTYYRVVAVDASGNATSGAAGAVNTSSITAAPIRINAGGPALTLGGVTWLADTYFSGGKTYANNSIVDVLGTTSDQLYRTERSATTGPGSFSYAIPLPTSGTYQVKLHFAEIYHGATGGGAGGTGKRVFSVNFEGGPVEINNLDLNAQVAPMTAYITTNNISVTDGTLNIGFSSTVDQPKVSAIEIVRVS